MKLGTLLTMSIVSLSAAGGGLALYVAATKYQTMEQMSVAQSRLAVVRAVGDIPRYLNPERGFTTNILFGPPAIDPKQRAELDTYRKQTDGAVDKMLEIRKTLPTTLDDSAALASAIDALKAKFGSLRDTMDRGIALPPEARRDAAKPMVAENSAFNAAVTALLDGQVRKLAKLDGDAYRLATYANIAWTLRDIGGLNASLHKSLVGAKRAATDAEKRSYARSKGRPTKSWRRSTNCATIRPRSGQRRGAAADERGLYPALRQGIEDGEGRCGSGKYDQDVDTFYRGIPTWLGRDHRESATLSMTARNRSSSWPIVSARLSFFIALVS